MDIGDWLTLSAILVALGLGVWANFQIRSLNIKEKKERQITEIVEWACDIGRCGGIPNISDLDLNLPESVDLIINRPEDAKANRYFIGRMHELQLSFIAMVGKNKYMEKIAPKYGAKLEHAVLSLILEVEKYIAHLENIIKSTERKIEPDKKMKKAEYTKKIDEVTLIFKKSLDSRLRLFDLVDKVITEAVDVKNRYSG